MKLRILPEAEEELDAARLYLGRQTRGLGRRFIRDFVETMADVVKRPLAYPKLESADDGTPFRRALLLVFRYVVVYEVLEREVLVIAVAHCSRAPNYWFRRRGS